MPYELNHLCRLDILILYHFKSM